MNPYEILKAYPYAYCVHRQRIWHLYKDLKNMPEDPQVLGVDWMPADIEGR